MSSWSHTQWRSPVGTLIRFTDSVRATTIGTSITISQLIPACSRCQSSPKGGEGPRWVLSGRQTGINLIQVAQTNVNLIIIITHEPKLILDRLAFFQLRIGPIDFTVSI